MRIALAQLNYTVNHFEGNIAKMVDTINRAKTDRVDLIVFSELAVCGYPPHDLLEREEFVKKCVEAVEKLASHSVGISVIVGAPSLNTSPRGKMLFNSAYVLSEGKIASVHHKSLLPDYDVFDEYRYFETNVDQYSLANNGNSKIAITVCEDLWDDQPVTSSFGREMLYRTSPMEKLSKLNPDFIINIAASPFNYNSEESRLEVFRSNVARYGLPVIYVNQVGGNTELLFDGGSMVLNSKGDVMHLLKSFEEDYFVIDTGDLNLNNHQSIESGEQMRIARIHDALVMGIRDYFKKMGFTKATLGLSGGIDSAVVLALAQRALGSEAIRVLLMPSQFSSQHSIDDAVALAKKLNIQYDIVGIQPIFDSFKNQLQPIFEGLEENITEENIQARVRGTLLMALSNKFGHLLLNTSNKSEAAVGYGTLYGDMNGAISVLGDVYKTDVYRLANYINRNEEIIPINTIVKPPSAELRPDQKDSDSLPPYDILDAILFAYIEQQLSAEKIVEKGFDPTIVSKVIRMVNVNEYKRFQAPPILRVSSKAFGFGRKMPLVAKW
ncbi:MAG TPA: NAD+ synthase [Tenuifilaceae bacterium]|nr:NAD+ synthase [Tenuifilaceae bacterium]HPN22513.1 NAD+ synthase [Tenuifilaceae bacterium]